MAKPNKDWTRYRDLRDDFLRSYPGDSVSQELEAMILNDEAMKRDFVQNLHLQAAVAVSFRRGEPLAETLVEPTSHNPMLVAAAATETQRATTYQVTPHRAWPHAILWSASVMAVVVWFTLIYFEIRSNAVPVESPLATIHSAEGCVWGQASMPTTKGSRLYAGRIQLITGTVRLDFRNTRVTLQGPVDFELISENRCKLHEGRVMMVSKNGGDGLVIGVPNGAIADQGAEIGVHVSASSFTELYVFSGHVKAKHCRLGESLEASESDKVRIQPDAIQKIDPESGALESFQPIAVLKDFYSHG